MSAHRNDESILFNSVRELVGDHALQVKLEKLHLTAGFITWEDTARNKNSCVGPNISDMALACSDSSMPVIRPQNFKDITVDMPIDKIPILVGNESREGAQVKRITLAEYLQNIALYTGNPKLSSMYRPERDSRVVVSAQACILPLYEGKVPFHVSLYNYQSSSDDPAVLVITSSPHGTSAQVVDRNTRALYLNDHGTAVEFVAKRLEDDRRERGVAVEGAMTSEEKDRNALYIIQVPLKTKPKISTGFGYKGACLGDGGGIKCKSMFSFGGGGWGGGGGGWGAEEKGPRGMDHAMLEKGTESKGAFEGTRGLALERDYYYPIRVTVQFYAVTDTPHIADSNIEYIAENIQRIYSLGEKMSSLVTDKNTGRVTEPKKDDSAVWASARQGFSL